MPPNHLDKRARQQVLGVKVEQRSLPSAEELEKLREIYPKSVEIIFSVFQKHGDFITQGRFWMIMAGIISAFVINICFIGLAVYSIYKGHLWPALLYALIPAIGLLTAIFKKIPSK